MSAIKAVRIVSPLGIRSSGFFEKRGIKVEYFNAWLAEKASRLLGGVSLCHAEYAEHVGHGNVHLDRRS